MVERESPKLLVKVRVLLFLFLKYDRDVYPSLVEGTGLENQEVARVTRGFESLNVRLIFEGRKIIK